MPLIHFWVVEDHHPERVLQQFGMKQGIPVEQHQNWAQVHQLHIAKWAAHAEIADAPPFHGEMSYNDEYMVWFRPRTVCHITKETSYWDTLVSLQRLFCYKCTRLRIV